MTRKRPDDTAPINFDAAQAAAERLARLNGHEPAGVRERHVFSWPDEVAAPDDVTRPHGKPVRS